MRIENQQVTAMSVSVGDWLELDMGMAYQVLIINRLPSGKLCFGFVKGKTVLFTDYDIVDLLIAA